MDVVVSSTAFTAGSPIPVDFTCDGANMSPPVSWTSMPPDTTKSIALVFDDADANGFTHWIVFNLSPAMSSIAENAHVGTLTNDFDTLGYSGPCPPRGTLHHYWLHVYGLDTVLPLKPEDKREAFDRALNGHVVAQGKLVGTYMH